jgi:hypothetical protein
MAGIAERLRVDAAALPFQMSDALVAQTPRVTYNDVMEPDEARLRLVEIYSAYHLMGLPVETDEQKQLVLQGVLAHLMLNSASPYQTWKTHFEANGARYPLEEVGKILREDARQWGRVYCGLCVAMVQQDSDLARCIANRWNVPQAMAHIGHDLVADSFELQPFEKDAVQMMKNSRLKNSSRSDLAPVPGINRPVRTALPTQPSQTSVNARGSLTFTD